MEDGLFGMESASILTPLILRLQLAGRNYQPPAQVGGTFVSATKVLVNTP